MKRPPILPSDDEKTLFLERFQGKSDEALQRFYDQRPAAQVQLSGDLCQLAREASSSKVVKESTRLTASALDFIFSRLQVFGLTAWRPDLDEAWDSAWNRPLCIIAVQSFRDACQVDGYSRSGINDNFCNASNLQTWFRHYVFYHWRAELASERNRPGSLAQRREDNLEFKRRKTVCQFEIILHPVF